MPNEQKSMLSVFLSVVSLITGIIAMISFTGFIIAVNTEFRYIQSMQIIAFLFAFFKILIISAVILAGAALIISIVKKSNKMFSIILLAIWITITAIIFFTIIFVSGSFMAPYIYYIF